MKNIKTSIYHLATHYSLLLVYNMKKEYDYLIVGAGLYGAVFASQATQNGKKCLVIDRRPHIGGNLYCENIAGINVHQYGPHIFHTSDVEVWNFVNSIVPFNRFTNEPLANYKGKLYNLPFNMNTFYQMWGVTTPEQAQAKIDGQKAEAVAALNGREPANLEEQALILVGKDIFNTLIKDYTEKQWGRKCTELPAFIIKRLPVRMIFDNNYFNDKYQGIPIGGYNKLIEGLLEGADTVTGCDFQMLKREIKKEKDGIKKEEVSQSTENIEEIITTIPQEEYEIVGFTEMKSSNFKSNGDNAYIFNVTDLDSDDNINIEEYIIFTVGDNLYYRYNQEKRIVKNANMFYSSSVDFTSIVNGISYTLTFTYTEE